MPNFDPSFYPYSSERKSTYARNGMVATSQPLAAQAGLDILKKGGNAVDAAIATAACLTVVEPTSNGIGGDAFALVWMKGELHGLNASGPAPQSISIEKVKDAGYEVMPEMGWMPVTIPGEPAAWATLSERFGQLSLSDVLQPAIEYAQNGYPLSPNLDNLWKKGFNKFQQSLKEEDFANWCETFAPEKKVPRIGEMWASPAHASTLRSIAVTSAESFYSGELAEKIAWYSTQNGGYLTGDDLSAYKPEWVNPIHVNYRGYDVWEIPPNGQGLIALEALNILKGFDFVARDDVDAVHKQIEAIKLAFADGVRT